MRTTVGSRPPRGTIRWVFNPSRDPATLAALATTGWTGLGLTGRTLTGMANGGFMTSINVNRHYLGVTAEGGFAFLERGVGPYGSTWLMPSTFASRPAGGGRIDFNETGDPTRGATAFGAYRGTGGQIAGDVESTGPALLRDGTVAWLATNRTLIASCPDGRTRWALEFWNPAYPAQIYAADDGNIVLASGTSGGLRTAIYRIDPDGKVLATRDMSDVWGGPAGYSDRCGLAFVVDSHTMPPTPAPTRYYGGPDFSAVRDIPPNAIPTNDCGWLLNSARYRPDGSLGFATPARGVDLAMIELTDGSWLLVSRGGETPPGMSIVADDGTLVFDTDFDPEVLGEVLTPEAYLLTPDGVLYVTATSDFFAEQQFAAIEVGLGPAPTWASAPFGLPKGNWARDNATWHPIQVLP